MRKRYWLLVFMVIAFAAEYFLSWKFYRSIVPFPEMEFWYTAVSSFLRDVLLLGVAGLLYLRRTRIRDRVKRYFPVVVTGVLYLGVTAFMVHQLRLDGEQQYFCGACNCHVLPQMGRAHHENGVFCRLFFVGSYCNF